MRYARNQSKPAPTDGSCYYDSAIGFSDGLTAGSSEDVSIEPEFAQFMKAEAAIITVAQSADRTLNGRVLIKSIRVNACDLESYNETDGVASGGRVAPDEFQAGDGDSCLGTPVCWGWFGKAALDNDLVARITNVSPVETDTYITVSGRQASALPAGMSVGRRCANPAG